MKLSQVIGLSVVVLGCAMPMQAAFAHEGHEATESQQQGQESNSDSSAEGSSEE